MSRTNLTAQPAENRDSFFRETDWLSLPELNSPAVIVIKTEQSGREELIRLGSFLSEEEMAKSLRFRFNHDRMSYVVVHGLLRWILGKHLGVSPKEIGFSYGVSGKPSITGYDRRMFFNLSHSSGVSVLAFDPGHEIGADVEKISEDFEYEPIVEMFFTNKERAYIHDLKELSRERFYELWTRKEAFLKATGAGITKDLRVEVLEDKMTGNAISGQPGKQMDLLFKSMIYDNNYRITLALNPGSSGIRLVAPGDNAIRIMNSEA